MAALAGALNFGSVAASAQILRRRAILGGVARGCGRFLSGALTFLFVCSFVFMCVYCSNWREWVFVFCAYVAALYPLFHHLFLFFFRFMFRLYSREDGKCAKHWSKRSNARDAERRYAEQRRTDLFYLTFVVLSFVVMPMASAVATADASARAEGLNRGGPKAGKFGNDLLAAPARKVVQAENSGGRDSGAASNGFVMLGEPPRPRAVRRSERR